MPRESSPEVEVPIGIISTVWPGASSGDVESLITEKIEQEVKGLEKLEKYTSVSRDGLSIVTVEFESGSDMVENRQKLREALDDAEPKLPNTIPDDPRLETASASNTPILSLSLSGDFALTDLKRFAESLQNEMEGITGVRDVLIGGLPEEKVHVYIDPLKLRNTGLSVETIAQKLQGSHRDLPLGSIFVDGEQISLRLQGEFVDTQDFIAFPLLSQNGKIVRLGDIATVRREFDERDVESYFFTGEGVNPSLTLDIIKSEAKTDVAKAVNKALNIVSEFRKEGQIPPHLAVDITFNNADDIQTDLDRLIISGGQTLILITIILLFALGWREALLAAVSIPLSAFIAIGSLQALGETFNFLSLFALILSVGLLVDNAIIMVEGVSENIYYKKLKPIQAAIMSLQTFRWPIITGTCTTIFAFLPMMFLITGVSGQFIRVIPLTVAIVLTASLVVSLFFVPVLAALFYTVVPPQASKEDSLLTKVHAWYEPWIKKILYSTFNTVLSLVIAVLVLAFSVGLMAKGKIPVEIFPGSDEGFFTAKIELPKGTKLKETRALLPAIQSSLQTVFDEANQDTKQFKNAVVSVGQVSNFDPEVLRGAGGSPESHVVGMTINMVDKKLRDLSTDDGADLIKETLLQSLPPHAEVTMGTFEGGPPSGSTPIEIRLVSEDLEHLERVTDDLSQRLEGLTIENGGMLKEVVDNRGEILPQITWKLDREKMDRLGLSLGQISQTLRSATEGVQVLSLSEGEDEIDVEMRLDFRGDLEWTDPDTLSIVEAIPLQTQSGQSLTLGDIAEFSIGPARSVIRHYDGKRVVNVGAEIEGKATASQFKKKLDETLKELDRRPGDTFEIGGDNEESDRLIKEMLAAMIFAMFLIAIVLVLQFNSFVQPFIILAAIPLSLTAVFIGFWISQTPISFPTMIGIVALAGIIVNDDIVLIDRINHHRKEEPTYEDALAEGCKSRMQPIFLTSITTVVGMLPLALSDPIWQGLGFALIYGMSLSTVLTLLLTPCLLITVDRMHNWFMRKVLRRK